VNLVQLPLVEREKGGEGENRSPVRPVLLFFEEGCPLPRALLLSGEKKKRGRKERREKKRKRGRGGAGLATR